MFPISSISFVLFTTRQMLMRCIQHIVFLAGRRKPVLCCICFGNSLVFPSPPLPCKLFCPTIPGPKHGGKVGNVRRNPMTSFRTHWIVSIVAVVAFARIVAAGATTANIDIDLDKPGPAIPPTLYGLMTEEINHSYDGGLYAELVQNRTFQDNANTPIHWSVVGNGKISMDSADPVNPALPISLRLDLAGGEGGAANDGFWGIPVKPDTQYVATFYAKAGGGFSGPVTAAIVTDDGKTIAKAETAPITTTWQKYTLTLSSSHDAVTTAHFEIRHLRVGHGVGAAQLGFIVSADV